MGARRSLSAEAAALADLGLSARCVGSDVAQARLEVGVPPSGEPWTVDQDEAGLETVTERLVARRPPTMPCPG